MNCEEHRWHFTGWTESFDRDTGNMFRFANFICDRCGKEKQIKAQEKP